MTKARTKPIPKPLATTACLVAVGLLLTLKLAPWTSSPDAAHSLERLNPCTTRTVSTLDTVGEVPAWVELNASSFALPSAGVGVGVGTHLAIQPHLTWQRLSHHALHKALYQSIINAVVPARGLEPRNPAVVVGVEYGDDIIALAHIGFPVIGFEPMAKFREGAEKFVARDPQLSASVKLLPYAVVADANATPTVPIQYQDEPVQSAQTVTLDAKLPAIGAHRVALLSVDVQGAEPGILEGAKTMLHGGKVGMVLVEVSRATDSHANTCLAVGKTLVDAGYVIFDFCWWGESTTAKSPLDHYLCVDNEGGARTSLDAYCARVDEVYEARQFLWMQTDFVAVHRDALTDATLHDLATLARRCDSNCRLRELILASGGNDATATAKTETTAAR